jgi:hypothetical protein
MTTEEARNTEVKTTRTERSRYVNAHILCVMCDVNDGLVGVVLEACGSDTNGGTTSGEEQRAKREKERTKDDKREGTRNKGKIQT